MNTSTIATARSVSRPAVRLRREASATVGSTERRRIELAVQRTPHARRRQRHLDRLGAAPVARVIECVDHRVDDRRRRTYRAELADALDAQRVDEARDGLVE